MKRAFVWMCAGLCVAVAAQQQQQQPQAEQRPEPPPLKVQVNEVIVPVTVTDVKNRFISNLEQTDFQIFEDGVEQTVKFFSRDRNQPVVVGFILDLSSSARIHWNNYRDSAKEMAWILLSPDKKEKYSGFLVTYSTEAELAVNTTTDPGKITDRIDKLKTGGGSALFDAIQLAITKHHLIQGEPIEPRRVLVVVGSGNDNASKNTIVQTIELAQRNLVTIYGVSTTAYGFANTEGDANLTRLAEETTGAWNIRCKASTAMWTGIFRSRRTPGTTRSRWRAAAMRRQSRRICSTRSPTSPAR